MRNRWSIGGAIAGFLIGLLAGGIGVAALGAARPILLLSVLAIAGAIIGNRIGAERDRR